MTDFSVLNVSTFTALQHPMEQKTSEHDESWKIEKIVAWGQKVLMTTKTN